MNSDSLFTPARIGRAGEDVALQIGAVIRDERGSLVIAVSH
ncbi:MAG: hypothetical protein QNK24_08400 [Desulfuromusa sp.]|nr:hypothetical protein [Desulfuromusa sp.]